ncbi:MAG TPA: hypothetical protein VFM08_02860 [Nocardioides sp.]|nr:hypothetical protein [Nocardioides sp.]
MSAEDVYPPGPPGTPASPSDRYFVGLTYSRAKNAFWLGFFAVLCFGPLTGIPAVYLGGRALGDIEASGGRLKGRLSAWEGIVLGALGSLGGLGVFWLLIVR